MTARDPQAWGVEPGYEDATGVWRPASPAGVEAVLDAMGAATSEPPARSPVLVVRRGERRPLDAPAELHTEQGETLVVQEIPPDLAEGYHTLVAPGDGTRTSLIVSPGRCHLPPDLEAWGWAVQLYAARSARSWGMGDLADLALLARRSAELGAGVLLVNPLHAAGATVPQEASPYWPSSRRFRNPLYLSVEDVAGSTSAVERSAGRALNDERRIDRDAVYAAKMPVLRRLWDEFTGDDRFDHYCRREGHHLEDYATFCLLTEEHGAGWPRWPEGLRHPARPEVRQARERQWERVRFHMWLQWLLDVQLGRAAAEIGLVHDLAVGVDPEGADAWLWQDAMAPGISVGAPPDEFNRAGQDWGVAALDPWRLRQAGYQPFIDAVRPALRAGAGLRVDHVMGLFRLYWVPRGAEPGDGVYVRYPADDLLDILALESARAGAYVVGEDLGTVEAGVREELARRAVLSYRLVWFEESPPSRFPRSALGAVTTHDLPTVAGVWTGRDLEAQRQMGLLPDPPPENGLRQRLLSLCGDDDELAVEEVIERVYAALAAAPCALIAATLEDALAVEERPNMPGTTDQWPNWSLALPVSLERALDHPTLRRVAEILRGRGPTGRGPAGD